MSKLSDSDLVKLLVEVEQGSKEAFTTVYVAVKRDLEKYIRGKFSQFDSYVINRIVHDTFVKMRTKLNQFEGKNAWGWISTIAYRIGLDVIKDAKRWDGYASDCGGEEGIAGLPAGTRTIDELLRCDICNLWDELNDDEKIVLEKYTHGYKYREIGLEFLGGVSRARVAQIMSNIRNKAKRMGLTRD